MQTGSKKPTTPPPILDPETSAKVLKADVANILAKAKSGRPLSKYEREIVSAATRQEEPEPKPSPAKNKRTTTAAPTAAAQVRALIVLGHTGEQIRDFCRKEFPGRSPEKIVAQAREDLIAAGKADRALVNGWCVEAWREIYRNALTAGEFSSALRAVELIHRAAHAQPSGHDDPLEKVMGALET